MAGDYEKAITIREAIDKIDGRDLLLPAIQRKFVWTCEQICTLFDSLMRDYPINTFMFWDVNSKEIKNKYKFYEFMREYCERFREDNDYFVTAGHRDFKAVIDGQQRLTAIYIGLKGTYSYKKPRIWWPSVRDDQALPPRSLYLDLAGRFKDEEGETQLEYNFKFLTKTQYESSLGRTDVHWYRVGEILNDDVPIDQFLLNVAMPYLTEHGLANNEFARAALLRLYRLVNTDKVIHYYNEASQDIDHVLDVFIRTNSGGTPLAFSDLMMSFAIAHWQGDARKDIDTLVANVWQSSEMRFGISRDLVLKACLMLTGADIRFKIKNFDGNGIHKIESNWNDIRDCIIATFKLINLLGLNDQSLRAKNAALPIVYYLYKQTYREQPLYHSINNLAYLHEERQLIAQWLHMALLKGVFGGQGDALLTSMRKVIDDNLSKGSFPLPEIIEAFKITSKDLRFDDEYVDKLLQTQHGDPTCRSILALIYPEMNMNQQYHIDHLHPQSAFQDRTLQAQGFLANDPDLFKFYSDRLHWNSIPNLHLLNVSQNTSKQDQSLADWVDDPRNGFRRDDLLVSSDVSLHFSNFKQFHDNRREALRSRLKSKLYMTSLPLLTETDEEDQV